MSIRIVPAVLAGALALALPACGREEGGAPEPARDEASAVDAPAPSPAPENTGAPDAADDDASRPLEVADLDAYARGVRYEIEQLEPKVEAVKAARAKQDDAAETAALLAMTTSIDEGAARAAGVAPTRWDALRSTIDEVLGARQMADALQPQIAAMEQADMSAFTEEQKAQAAQNIADMKAAWGDPYAKLPPDVAAAMKAREAELAALRNEAFALRLSVL